MGTEKKSKFYCSGSLGELWENCSDWNAIHTIGSEDASEASSANASEPHAATILVVHRLGAKINDRVVVLSSHNLIMNICQMVDTESSHFKANNIISIKIEALGASPSQPSPLIWGSEVA